jgi:hypothetical protein
MKVFASNTTIDIASLNKLIEKCLPLKELYIGDISSVDMDFSLRGCQNIESLELHGNVGRVRIDECPNLTTVYITMCPNVSSIEIQACSGLKVLDLSQNSSLYAISLDGCQNLIKFCLRNLAQLARLCVRRCAALTGIFLKKNSAKRLHYVEISNCPLLNTQTLSKNFPPRIYIKSDQEFDEYAQPRNPLILYPFLGVAFDRFNLATDDICWSSDDQRCMPVALDEWAAACHPIAKQTNPGDSIYVAWLDEFQVQANPVVADIMNRSRQQKDDCSRITFGNTSLYAATCFGPDVGGGAALMSCLAQELYNNEACILVLLDNGTCGDTLDKCCAKEEDKRPVCDSSAIPVERRSAHGREFWVVRVGEKDINEASKINSTISKLRNELKTQKVAFVSSLGEEMLQLAIYYYVLDYIAQQAFAANIQVCCEWEHQTRSTLEGKFNLAWAARNILLDMISSRDIAELEKEQWMLIERFPDRLVSERGSPQAS